MRRRRDRYRSSMFLARHPRHRSFWLSKRTVVEYDEPRKTNGYFVGIVVFMAWCLAIGAAVLLIRVCQ